MHDLFVIVFKLLVGMSNAIGLTYHEINIIVYYFFIPLVYLTMLDKILKTHALKVGFTLFFILVVIFTDFTDFSDLLFWISVKFLLSFSIIGWNYIVSSVIICVFVPLLVFIVLFYFSYFATFKNWLSLLFRATQAPHNSP